MDELSPSEEQNIVGAISSASSVNGHEFISLLETETDDFGVGLQLESFIRTDNKQAFVSYLKTLDFDDPYNDHPLYDEFETRLLKLLCFRRAIGCATAFLNGETGLPKVDLNCGLRADPLELEVCDNPRPLQLVAKMLCYGLTELFLEHGADPCGLEIHLGLLKISERPLLLALDTLCGHKIVKDFPAGESVYKLFSLFRHQELKEAMDTIKLLASRIKQLMIYGVYCVVEWNLVKLVVLLIVARDKLVIDNEIYSNPIAKMIGLQHGLESDLGKKEVARAMLQALRLVEMSPYFLLEDCTTSMAENGVVPLEVANKFLAGVKLHDEVAHMVSADLDRLAAELFRRNKDFLETAFPEKKCSKRLCSTKRKFSADIDCWAAQLQLGDKVLLETRLMKKMSSKSMITECICYCPWYPERDMEQDLGDSFYDHLNDAIFLDNRYKFVKVVNGMESFGSLGCDDNLPEIVRKLMFRYDSANCAAAVLAGETDAVLTLRDLTDVGWSFLHNAAKHAKPKLTALFLENGFLADDRRDCDELEIKAALPLNVVLESIRDDFLIRSWQRNKSAIDLLVFLCYEDFRNALETIRLLVLKTTNVYSEFLRYLKEGKMVELCALLMVAHKELLASAYIAVGAGHARYFSMSTGHGNSDEHTDPLEKKGTLLLLDIFGKIGDYLSAYIRLEQRKGWDEIVSDVAWLIVRAGISDAPVSKITNTPFSRMPFADHKKLLAGSRCPKQAGMSMSGRRGTSSSMVFARVLHTPALEINADFASLVSAKRLVHVLRRRPPPMRCMSIVAALTSGFRLM